MRSEKEIMDQVLHVANTDHRIRAVLLSGSRANPHAKRDMFQDFDVTYVVEQIETFLADKNWIDVFGERLILQMPEEMLIGEKDSNSFYYLMLFIDGNRIDLTLFSSAQLQFAFKRDSLAIVLLDKDNLFGKLNQPNDADYLIKRPTEKEYTDCCNEFWWVSTYVGKGLGRKEITYAKQMMEIPVRSMFLKIIEWYIGTKTGFSVNFGKAGQHMKTHISPNLYNKILATYPDSNIYNIWKAMFLMADLFDELAKEVASSMNFYYNEDEANNVLKYLRWIWLPGHAGDGEQSP